MPEVMELLQRHLGFDSAALSPLSASWTVTWNKPAHFERLWQQRGALYVREVSGLVRSAFGAGVALDADVLSLSVRDRAAFYDEYMRPLGGGSFACIGLAAPGAESALSLTRYGRARFHESELELLRRLQPALALSVRGLATEASGPPSSPPALAALTAREREFSEYLSRGLTNGEIAALCGCSPNTVRNRLAGVFRKLHVSTRAELAALIASGET
jgi:DNA-binding CsgD family transcriptional regulator